ncbi:MAG: alpha/beta fold hydrolase [Trebonia sp.]
MDAKLVDSLIEALGAGYEVRYPRMPAEDDPSYAQWGSAIRRELATLDDGAVVVGHSVGGTVLMHVLSGTPLQRRLGAIAVLAARFVGTGGWPGDEFELPADLVKRLPQRVAVQAFYGLEAQTGPPSPADLYAQAIPQAHVHRLPGRDHQLNGDCAASQT